MYYIMIDCQCPGWLKTAMVDCVKSMSTNRAQVYTYLALGKGYIGAHSEVLCQNHSFEGNAGVKGLNSSPIQNSPFHDALAQNAYIVALSQPDFITVKLLPWLPFIWIYELPVTP